AQTKGRVESGIKYVKHNFWPGARFTDLDELNRQVLAWIDTVADVRVHGTTFERPVDRLPVERAHLTPLPGPERLRVPFSVRRSPWGATATYGGSERGTVCPGPGSPDRRFSSKPAATWCRCGPAM